VAGCAALLWSGAAAAQAAAPGDLAKRANALFGVLPPEAASAKNQLTDAKIDLGRMLYYDQRFSISQQLSCNSCHVLERFGVDNEPTSLGHKGQRGDRNSPTVYNAAFHIAQFWDGRAADVEEQAKGPVTNPVEMAMPDPDYVLEVLRSIPGYEPLFRAAFPGEADPIHFDNFGRAIGAFERLLVTPSRFDRFLAGEPAALSPAEQAGLATFIEVGCPTCHVGKTVGGTMFQKIGFVHPYPTNDIGREKVTGNEADRFFFKVPSLRNVEKTAPYYHNGSIKTLDEAIRQMAYYQLGKDLAPADVASINTFLGSLTGELPLDYIKKPELPPSTPKTPKPVAN
jgi:cytochrome c peroxidase